MEQGFSELEKKISLLIFPFVIYYQPKLSHQQIKIILFAFVAGCIFTAGICLVKASYHYHLTGDPSFFFYHNFSQLVGMHAIYFSMYVCFAMVILVYYFYNNFSASSGLEKVGYCTMFLLLVTTIILLGGRTHLFLMIVGLVAFAIHVYSRYTSLKRAILYGVIIGFFFTGVVLVFPANRERIKEAINYKGEYRLSGKWGENQMRPLIWNCAFSLVKTAPIAGVGTGDVLDELQQCYTDRDYVSLLIWEPVRFNAHNQFIETLVGLGFIGLIIFAGSMISATIHAVRTQNYFYLAFILLIAISFLTESMLQRQNGIVFFSFFNALLFFNNIKAKPDGTAGQTRI
jgi:O-antigen ligase